MKRLILTITIGLVLIGINTDVANAQVNWGYIARSEVTRHTGCFPRIGGGYNLSRLIRGGFGGRRYYGGYGCGRDRTLRRVVGYGGLAMDVLQMLDQNSANNRVLNSQISATNRTLTMAEREQRFRHQQIRTRNNRVLVRKGSIAQGNEELRKEVEKLRLEVEKLNLQQEIKKEAEKQ
ncbi:hypothetical protein KJA13_03415 [Patescibacteria group bacterium]|nr:hypothetical protein [Patescibacteria group bacterium]